MARKPRLALVVEGLPHHIILRGNNRRRLFSYPSDYRRFIWTVGQALRANSCRLHAMVLMANHVHLILTATQQPELSKFVQKLAQRYAQYRNKRRGGSGKLFEERYYCRAIDEDDYLAAAHAYVELNPVRAGIVRDPMDYPWSTYRLHAGNADASEIRSSFWTTSHWYQKIGTTRAERESQFRCWVDQNANVDQIDELAQCASRVETSPKTVVDRRRIERPDRSSAK